MTPDDLLRGSVYKSLETDDEFAERVRAKYPWYNGLAYRKGAELDDEVQEAFGMQRRIVERETRPSAFASQRDRR